MTVQGYFSNWSNYKSEAEPSEFVEFESSEEKESSVIDNPELQNFYYSPKLYFEKNGDNSPDLIQGFLNADLIHADSNMFKDLYIKLLRHTCLTREKEIPIQTISSVVGCNGYIPDREVVDFMIDEGLLDLTDELFDMLVLRCNKI